jgi:hypothetical protein
LKRVDPFLPGLPDGIFADQKFLFGYLLEGLSIENVGTFNGHLVNLKAIEKMSQPFGIFCGDLQGDQTSL